MKTISLSIIAILAISIVSCGMAYAESTSGQVLFMKSNSTGQIYANFTFPVLDNSTLNLYPQLSTGLSDPNSIASKDLTIVASPGSIIANKSNVPVTFTIAAKNDIKGVYSLFLFFCGGSPLVVGLNESEVNPAILNQFFNAQYMCPMMTEATPHLDIVGYSGIISKTISTIPSNTNNVEIQNIQVEPPEIKVGDAFTVNATLVNNSPNPITLQYGVCEGLFSVTFDNHVTVNQNQIVCPMMAVLEKIEPGEKTTMTSPGSALTYRATAAGTANATVTFSYFVRNQTDPNSQNIENTISKSFLFTISGNNTGINVPNETVLSPLKQVKSGVHAKDVACKSGYVLVIKSEDGSPACIKPSTAQNLVERGWGTIVTSPTPTSCPTGQTMVNGQCVTSIPTITPTQACNGDALIPYSYALPCTRPNPTCPSGMAYSNGMCTTTPPFIPPPPVIPSNCVPSEYTMCPTGSGTVYPSCYGAFSGNICQPNSISCPTGLQGDIYGTTCNYGTPTCSTGYSVVKISAGSYSCQTTNPPPLSNATAYLIGQKVGAFTISTINPYNVTGYYNNPYPLSRPGLGDFTIMHIGDTLNPICDGSAPLVITAINYPNSITVSIGKSMGRPIGGCPICLSANTEIDTPNGSINVKELKTGMQVWTLDSLGHKQAGTILKVGRTLVPPTHKMVHLILDDGRELFASPGHPTTDGRLLGDLKKGDILDNAKIKTVELVPYNENYTYDILPSGPTGFYWANGILLKSTLK